MKSTLGFLRPNFFLHCIPNITDCKPEQYIAEDEYECTNNNVDKAHLSDIYMSFPSGHTSAAMFYVVFLVVNYFNYINI